MTVIPQKVYYGSDTDKHGARIDVYLEELPSEENLSGVATVYDVDPDQKVEDRMNLPKRTRFYHAMIDAECLEAGKSYETLKNVVVILIVPFDPFGQDHMIYTIRNKCEELPELPYEDGARTLFLYTKGKKGQFSQELCDFLKYMEYKNEENAKTETLQKIQKMVNQVKMDKGVSLEYMKWFEHEEKIRKQGRREELLDLVKKKLEKGKSPEQIADELERELEEVLELIKEREEAV